MGLRRAHIIFPDDLIKEIDRLVGSRGRSRFIVNAAMAELNRHRQLAALRQAAGGWKNVHHPELGHGAARWVRQIRQESDQRGQRRKG